MNFIEFNSILGSGLKKNSFLFDNKEKASSTIYLDRMEQWDQKEYDKCCTKNFGKPIQMLEGVEPEKIEQFLCDYLEENVKLCRIETGTRQDNGYPWYRIDYKKIDSK